MNPQDDRPQRRQDEEQVDYGIYAPWVRLFAPVRTIAFLAMLQATIGPSLYYAQLGASGDQSRLQYYTSFAVMMLSIGIFLVHLPLVWRYLARNLDLLAFMGFAIFREVLSGDAVYMLYALNYLMVFAAVSVIVLVDGVEATMRRLYWFSIYSLVAHVVAFGFPAISIMRGGTLDGAFRGFSSHRNALAIVVDLALAVILARPRVGVMLRPALLLACFVLLVAAGSVQALIFASTALAFFAIYKADGLLPNTRFLGATLLIAGAAVLMLILPEGALDELLGMVGRDTTFSGRENVWGLAMYMIERVPLLGYGMGKFSSEALPEELLQIYRLGIQFGSAHSSYLQAILDFGWIGAGLFYIMVARHSIRVLFDLLRLNARRSAFPLILTVFTVVGGFIEAERLIAATSGWVLFVLAKLMFDQSAPDGLLNRRSQRV